MKINTVSLSRTIPTGPYMNDKITMEASLHPGESHETVLNNLSHLIDDWHKKANPHLYQESKPTHLPIQTERSGANTVAMLITDIYSCESIKVLESYRIMAKSSPELQAAYDQKMESLLNRPA